LSFKNSNKSVRVLAPATIANLVCGFDILGMAINNPRDVMELRIKEEPGICIHHKDAHGLSTEPSQNVAGVSLIAMLEEVNDAPGFDIVIDKRIKPGSGLGSSAASAAGVVVAANHLLNKPFSSEDLVRFAMSGEKFASGVKHADNIAPCIHGGITLIRSIFPLDIVPLSAPPLYVTVVHPQIEVKTADARQILRKEVQLKSAIKQWGNIAGLVAGLMHHDYGLIGRSLEDVIIEPVRSILIPGFDLVKKRSKEVGALGGGISGSGPSVFMLSKEESVAKQIEYVMTEIFFALGIEFMTYVTTVNYEGVQVIESSDPA
jgi:homoserine kinase